MAWCGFLRLAFLDFLPAILTGVFALGAALFKQPILGLVMLGVIPVSVLLTIRQLTTQKGVRVQLMRDCEDIDGAVIEQLGGLEYIRAANTLHPEIVRLRTAMEKRRRREMRHHFAMSLFGCAKALNEGFFHIIVLGSATYFALNGTLSYGDVLTFSILFLNVMAPLNEVHRVIDEGHESSLRVGDLLSMLASPVDVSFESNQHMHTPSHDGQAPPASANGRQADRHQPPEEPEKPSALDPRPAPLVPRQSLGEPIIVVDNLCAEYMTGKGERKRALTASHLRLRTARPWASRVRPGAANRPGSSVCCA